MRSTASSSHARHNPRQEEGVEQEDNEAGQQGPRKRQMRALSASGSDAASSSSSAAASASAAASGGGEGGGGGSDDDDGGAKEPRLTPEQLREQAAQLAILHLSEIEEAEAEAREFESSRDGFLLIGIGRMKLPPLGTQGTMEQRDKFKRACKKGDIPAIRRGIQLVNIETNLIVKTGWGNWRALNCASEHGQTEAVHLLLTTGADIEAVNNLGWTPLSTSCSYSWGNVATTRLLLRAGADQNIRNNFGWSPLFYAKSPESIAALVEAGADLTVLNKEGRTPLQSVTHSYHPSQERIAELERCEAVDASSGSSSPAADRRALWFQAGMMRRNDLAREVAGEGDGGWPRGVDIEMARIVVDYMGADGVPWARVIERERELKHTQSLQAAIEGVEEACEAAAAAAAAVQGCGGGGGGGGGAGCDDSDDDEA